jgi:hypothetical protein
MGLDTSHDCWSGSYSAFGRWRCEIAKAAGRPTAEGHLGERHVIEGDYPSRCYYGWWDENPEDILDVLLVHSDCEGYIFPHHLTPLADRLEGLLDKLPDEPWPYGARRATEQFINGLRKAADEYQIVTFH